VLCRQNVPGPRLTRKLIGDGGDGSYAIDSYTASHEAPTVATIDIEGAEYRALRGMGTTLQKTHPRLYIEVHPDLLRKRGTEPADLYHLLEEFGYDIWLQDHRVRDSEWVEGTESPPLNTDTYTPTFMLRAE
jgi:hypothetical protein